MKLPLIVLASLGGALALSAAPAAIITSPAPYPKDDKSVIESYDPAFEALLAADAVVEKLGSGFRWSEGPVWDPMQGALLFSDTQENRVYRWKDGAGITVYLEPSGFTGTQYNGRERGSNGLTLDGVGRLTLCQHGNRQVARLAADGHSFETVVAQIDGKRFSSPNDLCFDRAGNLFFTDPPYGLPSDTKQETTCNGVYRLDRAGKLTLLVSELARPNGVALSPDEKTLYIGSTDDSQPYIKAYPLNPDGTVGPGRVFFDGTEFSTRTKRHGGFDGMKVDALGNVWTSGPGGVLVIGAGGKLLGSIVTARPTANCAFGDVDHQTLYITANDTLLRVHTKVKGAAR
jgi:gluconolactonase